MKNKIGTFINPTPITKDRHWTNKAGKKLGNSFDKVMASKKAKTIILIVLLAILFLFIVPITNNAITLSILAVLLILSYVFKKLEKK